MSGSSQFLKVIRERLLEKITFGQRLEEVSKVDSRQGIVESTNAPRQECAEYFQEQGESQCGWRGVSDGETVREMMRELTGYQIMESLASFVKLGFFLLVKYRVITWLLA